MSPVRGPGPARPLAADARVDLLLPPDFHDLLQPEDPIQARVEVDTLLRRLLPAMPDPHLASAVEGMMRWRAQLQAAHVLLHGVVAVPAGEHSPVPVHWHVLAAALEVPAPEELDVGVLFSRAVGQRLDTTRAHVESFPSRMGWGVGVLTSFVPRLPEAIAPLAAALGSAGSRVTVGAPALPGGGEVGVAATVTGRHGSGLALGVLGICLDPDQVLELGALVTTIGAGSVLDPGATPTASDPGAHAPAP